jgi:hypothetical protein
VPLESPRPPPEISLQCRLRRRFEATTSAWARRGRHGEKLGKCARALKENPCCDQRLSEVSALPTTTPVASADACPHATSRAARCLGARSSVPVGGRRCRRRQHLGEKRWGQCEAHRALRRANDKGCGWATSRCAHAGVEASLCGWEASGFCSEGEANFATAASRPSRFGRASERGSGAAVARGLKW